MAKNTPSHTNSFISMRTCVFVVTVMLILSGATAYYYWIYSASSTNVAGDGQQKVLFWRSPMNPTEVYKEAGKDRMGMDLVPVYEGEEITGPPGTIRIDPATVQNIGVKTVRIERKPLLREIRTVGQVAYDEERLRRISPKFGGWIEQQYVNFTGQTTKKGQKLLDIYSPELVSTQEEYLVSLQYFNRRKDNKSGNGAAGAESLLRAAESRLRYWDISEAQRDALRLRGKITRTMSLFAPFKGVVVQKHIPEGGYVSPGQTLYEIAELSRVWVLADVYEYEAPWLQPGQEAEITLAYRPGASFRGKVTYIYPYLKNQTRTLQVRMELPNTDDLLFKPGMWADVALHTELTQDGLSVPVQSVIRTGKRDIALVALEGSRFAPRELRLGAQSGDDFEVLEGLEEGERVVTSAQFLINSESSLQSAIGKMVSPGPAQETEAQTPPAAAMPGAVELGKSGMPGMEMPTPGSARAPPAMPGQRKGE